MKAFEYNSLFSKAKLYMQRAIDADRESDLYPFWLSLALELVIRSTLAKIHPALLAESKNDSQSLLYAFGIEGKTSISPKSISISEALSRLSDIIQEFTKDDAAKAKKIIDERNAELHSGEIGFSKYPVDQWINEYYKIIYLLLKNQKLELSDLLGKDEASAALKMIDADNATIKKEIAKKISSHRDVFEELSQQEKDQKIINSTKELRAFGSHAKLFNCPACGNQAILSGERISTSETRVEDNELIEEVRYLPSKFFCFCCGFKVEGYNKLKYINATNVFIKKVFVDPLEYLDIKPEDYIDIDKIVEERIRDHYEESQYMDE